MNFQTAIFLYLLLFFGVQSTAQEVVDGPEGKKIILYADGTWVPFEQGTEEVEMAPFMADSIELDRNNSELEAARLSEQKIALRLIQKRLQAAVLEGELAALNSQEEIIEAERYDLRRKIEASDNMLAVMEDSLALAKDWTLLMDNMVYLTNGLRNKAINAWKLKRSPINSDNGSGVTTSLNKRPYAQYSVEEDLMLAPPTQPCEFLYAGVDSLYGSHRKDIRPELLFSFTDKGLEGHFVKRDLITGTVGLTSLSAGVQMLSLEVAVVSKQAPKLFGGFKKGEFMKFTTIEGEEIILINGKEDGGAWDGIRQAYVFRGQYPIGAKEFKLLSKAELDTVLIRWSKVQEKYQIYDVDILARQFACLLKT